MTYQRKQAVVSQWYRAVAGDVLARGVDADGLYEKIVGADDATAARLIRDYTKIAAAKDIFPSSGN